ncbi:hypothetical protein [Streptomyces sp. NPDC018584]|uniref:hypothetical protein n=1 Tax=unclassified Streptomyces TaxID=2593676 RepID=UPI003794D6EC
MDAVAVNARGDVGVAGTSMDSDATATGVNADATATGVNTDAAIPGTDAEALDRASRVEELLAPFTEAARSRDLASSRRGDVSAAGGGGSAVRGDDVSAVREGASVAPDRNASYVRERISAVREGAPDLPDRDASAPHEGPPAPRDDNAATPNSSAGQAAPEAPPKPSRRAAESAVAEAAAGEAPGSVTGTARTAPHGSASAATDAPPPPPPASARLPDAPPAATGSLRVLDVDDTPEGTTGGPAGGPPAPDMAPEQTTTRPRPTADDAPPVKGTVDLTPGPGAGRPFVSFARPALYDDTTTRLRPVGAWARPRAAAAAACAVLGLGLIGGAVTGSWLTGESSATGSTRSAYAVTGELWHNVPVDRLFPPALKGEGAGPGGADRSWTRVAVAPDSTCEAAFDPLLSKALAPAGCLRLLRATYTDATRSHVTTVGLLFTKADADGMRALRNRFTEEGLDRRPDLMPRTYPAKDTVAEDFGDAQRASWTVSVLPDAPVVAYAVSGFADGRAVTDPEPAPEAMGGNTASAPAQSGLGHEAKGIADRVERGLRKTIARAEET